jgi:pimeloyl-ACP methyl ester carboxylesterase
MTPIVLVHGGGLDRRCWDQLVPLLTPPAIAVDLPGRGLHPADLHSVTFETCAESVRDDVDAAGFDEIVLAGHSLAGCSMPAMIGLLGRRVRHAVFIGCTVPEQGASTFDTLDPEIQEMARAAGPDDEPRAMDDALAKVVLGNDLDHEQMAFCLERLVPEAPHLSNDPVDLAPLHGNVPATWIRTMQDIIVAPEKQLRFAKNVGPDCTVVDLDAGHMCMVSQPAATAAILNPISGPA